MTTAIGLVLSGATVAVAAPSVPSVPCANTCGGPTRVSLSQAGAYFKNKHVGPNKYTSYGELLFTGIFYRHNSSSGTGSSYYYSPGEHVYNKGLAVMAKPGVMTGPDGVAQPDSWYNPASWDWGHIFSVLWSKVAQCAKGAAKGLVGTASGTLAVNLLAKGAKLVPGPYGYAAVAIGGCVWALVS